MEHCKEHFPVEGKIKECTKLLEEDLHADSLVDVGLKSTEEKLSEDINLVELQNEELSQDFCVQEIYDKILEKYLMENISLQSFIKKIIIEQYESQAVEKKTSSDVTTFRHRAGLEIKSVPPTDLHELVKGLNYMDKSNPMAECILQEFGEYISYGTEALHLEKKMCQHIPKGRYISPVPIVDGFPEASNCIRQAFGNCNCYGAEAVHPKYSLKNTKKMPPCIPVKDLYITALPAVDGLPEDYNIDKLIALGTNRGLTSVIKRFISSVSSLSNDQRESISSMLKLLDENYSKYRSESNLFRSSIMSYSQLQFSAETEEVKKVPQLFTYEIDSIDEMLSEINDNDILVAAYVHQNRLIKDHLNRVQTLPASQ